MNDILPEAVRLGLEAARKDALKSKNRLRVHVGEHSFRVLRFWDQGFSIDVEDAPSMRGLVDLFDGSRHLYQCLIIASREEDGEQVFEFKRSTMAEDTAPLDFVRAKDAPIALLN